MIHTIAGGIPTEIEYVYQNYTHYEVARDYAIKVIKDTPFKS